ncbi:MAG: hypothetical protein WCW47_00705 [Candidatus Paceibacterota bacterium]|jgi:hypothetical protein
MISIEKCREILGENMSDSQVEKTRDALYAMVESILDNYLEEFVIIDTCKKQSFTVESPQQSKAPKGMGLIVRNIVAENTLNKEDMMS